jgi:hypothetical protein
MSRKISDTTVGRHMSAMLAHARLDADIEHELLLVEIDALGAQIRYQLTAAYSSPRTRSISARTSVTS